MLGARRVYDRWLPVAGGQAARYAERAVLWQRGGAVATLVPPSVAAFTLPAPDSNSTMGLLFTYVLAMAAITQTVAFMLHLRVRKAALLYWQVTPEEKPTFNWRHPETVRRWLAVHMPGAITDGQG